jgi:peptidoglycan hydrolase-like protein with peptidoglycan-binding domain
MNYPCIPLVVPAALKAHKNGQLPKELLARVKTGGQMYAPVAEEFNKMYDAALAAGFKLRNVGDYRSFEGQLSMFMDRYTLQDLGRKPQVTRQYEGKTWYLKPGKAPSAAPDPTGTKGSNHGWGLAIDLGYELNGKLTSMGGACFDWMCENAPKYGFYLQTGDRNSKNWEAWHWQYCLGDAKPDGSVQVPIVALTAEDRGNQSLRRGNRGEDVKAVQRIVGAKPDGDFGAKTEAAVKVWQEKHGLVADGVWGNMSDIHSKNCTCGQPAPAPAPAPQAPQPAPAAPQGHPYPGEPVKIGSTNIEAVKLVQAKVAAKVDGDFGSVTRQKVRDWQRRNNLHTDGVVGPKTWAAMFG